MATQLPEKLQSLANGVVVFNQSAVEELMRFLVRAHAAAVDDLVEITEVKTDEQYKAAEETLVKAKKLYDKMYSSRKAITDPVKKAIEEMMAYENSINYTTRNENAYNRVREMLDLFNQEKIRLKKENDAKAAKIAEVLKYKAEFKAKVQEQLADKLAGLHRTAIDSMIKWENDLTLKGLEASFLKLKQHTPSLKREKYDECFHRWRAKPSLMSAEEEDVFLEELKKELTYEVFNEKFQQIVAPIKNEYLAKEDVIRRRLEEKEKADEAEKKRLEQKLKQEQEEKRVADFEASEKLHKQAVEEIKDQKDASGYEADFTQQGLSQQVQAGPSKKVASFENPTMWLAPLLQVIGKSATHPKFKATNDKGEFVPEIAKWLRFYEANIAEPIKGIVLDDKAKTIVKSREA